MDFLANLWLPILLSGVAVFIVSSVMHMVVWPSHGPIHKNDYDAMPGEDVVRAAMRDHNMKPGNYSFPHCRSLKGLEQAELREKFNEGPVGFMTVLPNGLPAMGKALAQWFLLTLFVGAFVAYASWLAVGATGADPRHIFRITSTIAVLGYGVDALTDSVWKGVKWSTSLKFLFDGLLYGLATGAVFAWQWPEAG